MTRVTVATDKNFVIERLKELSKSGTMDATYWISKKIEDEGFIRAEYHPNPAGRGRTIKVFVPTTKGKKLLESAEKKALKEKAKLDAVKIAKTEAAKIIEAARAEAVRLLSEAEALLKAAKTESRKANKAAKVSAPAVSTPAPAVAKTVKPRKAKEIPAPVPAPAPNFAERMKAAKAAKAAAKPTTTNLAPVPASVAKETPAQARERRKAKVAA